MTRDHRLQFLVIVLLCSFVAGCNEESLPVSAKPTPTPPHPLVGTWSLLAFSTNPIPAAELQTITNTLGWMEFRSDNTYTSVFASRSEDFVFADGEMAIVEIRRGGKYKEIYNSLTLKSGTNEVETHSIKITDDQLLLVTPQESNTVVHTYLRRHSP